MVDEIGLGALVMVIAGAGAAGFVSGLAGFGTGLVAIALWLHVLPAQLVPPLVVISSVAGQLVGVAAVRRAISWRALSPYLAGALVGVPLGVLALGLASPGLLRAAVGLFLVAISAFLLPGNLRLEVGDAGRRSADALVGAGGGFLGGFAGLSGPLPIVWLRLRGGSPDAQRAIYQPFNLLVLSAAALTMGVQGHFDRTVLVLAGYSLPATLLGARLGLRCYRKIDASTFLRVAVGLLFVSGLALTFGW